MSTLNALMIMDSDNVSSTKCTIDSINTSDDSMRLSTSKQSRTSTTIGRVSIL